jgi:anti-sigma regulatory factor (Ser/Thr protein kinase)
LEAPDTWDAYQVKPYLTRLDSDLGALAAMRRSLASWLERTGMPEPPLEAVVLATHEAVVNSIQHAGASGPVEVRASHELDEWVVEVEDDGHWKTRDVPRPDDRGRGIDLMRALVSRVEIITNGGGTLVRLHEPWERTPEAPALHRTRDRT